MIDPPLLSVVIPVFNRERLIIRALSSVLADTDPDLEIVVVDDGSSDGTVESVLSIVDPRVRLIRHPTNQGRCSARNTGAAAARGSWIVILDSDDELVPGGLGIIRRRALAAASDVGKLMFMCRDDSGVTSPEPPLTEEVIDYKGYLSWLEKTSRGRFELLPCPRRSALLACPYPAGRHWQEGIHELDFARHWRIQLCPEVVRLYHFDAPNRVMMPDRARLLAQAEGFAEHAEAVLARHGAGLARIAPTSWAVTMRQAALFRFLNGNRWLGARHSVALLLRQPTILRAWTVLVLGLLGRVPLAAVVARRHASRAA